MAKKKTHPIVKVDPLDKLPVHMQDVEDTGIQELAAYVIPPRIKIVQRSSDDELLDRFNVGDVILSPANQLVCAMEVDNKNRPTGECEGFLFTPLFFFPEWIVQNPIQLRGKAPFIRERSLDSASKIAQFAKNPSLRVQPHPTDDNMQIRYTECLNFIVSIPGIEGSPIMTFARGSHGKGSAFCSLAKQRKAPLYGCVFQAHLTEMKNDQGSWWVLEIANPDGKQSPWVDDEEQFAENKKAFEELKQAHLDARIVPDYDDSSEEGVPTGPDDEVPY